MTTDALCTRYGLDQLRLEDARVDWNPIVDARAEAVARHERRTGTNLGRKARIFAGDGRLVISFDSEDPAIEAL